MCVATCHRHDQYTDFSNVFLVVSFFLFFSSSFGPGYPFTSDVGLRFYADNQCHLYVFLGIRLFLMFFFFFFLINSYKIDERLKRTLRSPARYTHVSLLAVFGA